MRKKVAFVTGITGQDGSYLAELLLDKGYIVHGLVRSSSTTNTSRIAHLCTSSLMNQTFFLHKGDLADFSSLKSLLDKICPDEIYNLGAMSHVKTSFEIPEYTANIDGLGVLRLLEIIRLYHPNAKLYQASTSELYGKVQEIPQNENTSFHPRSPYGVAKLYAYWIVVNYREAYNVFAANGILFNHESPRRGELFVTRKITRGVARIVFGSQETLVLGNLDAKRDWGYAKDYVEGMWMMLQQEKPEDFVLATGKTHSVREFLEFSFGEVGIQLDWVGSGVEEKGIDIKTGRILVEVSPEFFRPSEVDLLIGDPTKARTQLGWAAKTSFKELAGLMVRSDLEEEERATKPILSARMGII